MKRFNPTQMTRDWLTVYTDLEILIIQKIFEFKTNFQIGKELGLSSKSINIRILTIFKKLGMRTGLASKNLIIYNFGAHYAQYLEQIKSFSPVQQEDCVKGGQFTDESEKLLQVDFIMRFLPNSYEKSFLMSASKNFFTRVFRRACRASEEINALAIMTEEVPTLPHSSVATTCVYDCNRILLLFPRFKRDEDE